MGLQWVRLVNFAAAWEAESLVEQLRSAGIHAMVKPHDVGIFGLGFAGRTPRGVDVMVTSNALAAARDVLAAFRGTA